ncbi:MAG: FAD-dependent oxidoreductase, partial [bacterium]|nr:FAD-dependent oxidoreductase [bacterium]
MPRILIVGGVAGGASAAARLRRLDETAEIIIFERGEHVSYANCGLPYYVGGVITDRARLFMQTPETLHKLLNLDVRVMHEVLEIDRQACAIKVKNLLTDEVATESYDTLILSPGATSVIPPIGGLESVPHFAMRNVRDTDTLVDYIAAYTPKDAVVIGGGFIGIELAENLAHRGMKVSLVEARPQVLPVLDPEMAALVHEHLRRNGITLHLGKKALTTQVKDGKYTLTLDEGTEIVYDLLSLAAGVRPNSKLAKEAGLTLLPSGAIAVNELLQTSDPKIFAIGDVIEVIERVSKSSCHLPLAGPANKQGRKVADIIAGDSHTYKGAIGTSILKVFDLTVASTGLSETELKKKGRAVDSV